MDVFLGVESKVKIPRVEVCPNPFFNPFSVILRVKRKTHSPTDLHDLWLISSESSPTPNTLVSSSQNKWPLRLQYRSFVDLWTPRRRSSLEIYNSGLHWFTVDFGTSTAPSLVPLFVSPESYLNLLTLVICHSPFDRPPSPRYEKRQIMEVTWTQTQRTIVTTISRKSNTGPCVLTHTHKDLHILFFQGTSF